VSTTPFWIDLKKRITAVALMQILPIGYPHVQEMMIAFERALCANDFEDRMNVHHFSLADHVRSASQLGRTEHPDLAAPFPSPSG
jgi:hypothetical protein